MIAKYGMLIPFSREIAIDGLPIRTMFMSNGEKAAEYLALGQSVKLGRPRRHWHDIDQVIEEPSPYHWDYGWPLALQSSDDW